jgi:tetratricopeptide (TPR) repeat protein
MQFNLVGNLFAAAQAALSGNRLAEAESLCRQALQLNPREPACLFLMGVIAGSAGQPAAALDPNLAEAHENRGIALANLGRSDEAEAAFRRAIALAPGRAESWRALGNLKSRQGDEEAAQEAFGKAQALRPPA